MHPPLIVDKHPICGKYMTALMVCHKEHTISKWWGACNDEHWALTRCLAEEKKVIRCVDRQAAAAAAAAAGLAAAVTATHSLALLWCVSSSRAATAAPFRTRRAAASSAAIHIKQTPYCP
jgi:hypothetical protein